MSNTLILITKNHGRVLTKQGLFFNSYTGAGDVAYAGGWSLRGEIIVQ